ncbi:MAG: hypothetical protein LBJ41_08620 [Treponema sp.]|nr:hypothetical protein [Treponema sp.]
MSMTSYLETLPLTSITRSDGPPKNAIPFAGYLRQHPAEKNKLILIHDPLGESPTLMEFKIDDVMGAEELHSAVTLGGEATPLIKLFVRKGARGVILEPFEVDDPIRFVNKPSRILLEHVWPD